MRTLTLSNHTAEKASAAAGAREAEYLTAFDEYEKALVSRDEHITAERYSVSNAWRHRNILAMLSSVIRLGRAYLSRKPDRPSMRSAETEEIVWASGNEGERKVAAYLSRQLSDEWILVSGYRNSKGEIDQILLGPQGIFAFEIKFINGVVHCDGDSWWSDKYDRYGNLVEPNKPLADKRGRGPSKQLNDSVDLLEAFLAKRVNLNRVHRAVVLSHDLSQVGQLKNITVDTIAIIDSFDLDLLFSRSSTNLDPQEIERVLQAIQKDHNFHEKPRLRREQSTPIRH